MSRIGKQPIPLPAGVTAAMEGPRLTVSGPKGTLVRMIHPEVSILVDAGVLTVLPVGGSRKTPALWGLTRAVILGMVQGVSQGFEKKLEIEGVGYRATLDGAALSISIGFSHPVRVQPPRGILFRVEKNAIIIGGINKELVGNTTASIRAIRPPEPYKGKGIRYAGEIIKRKAGKKAVASSS